MQALDQHEFSGLIESYRRELQAHCYRMMGSIQDAEDMVQESFLKAWHRRDTFEGRASLRAWLYKICTNTCLDALRRRPRRYAPVTHEAVSTLAEPIAPEIPEPIWLEPYPDHLLYVNHADVEEQFSRQENIALAFVVALHVLPPRQRAVLILCDVLEWRARETAVLLGTTAAAVKSALHRARSTLAARGYVRDTVSTGIPDEALLRQLDAYVCAWEQADVAALVSLLMEDATFSMPPIPSWYRGKDTIHNLVSMTVFSGQARGRWRLLPTRANRQPAFGVYRQSERSGEHDAYGIQVLTFQDGLIADIITFRNPALLKRFNLPLTLA